MIFIIVFMFLIVSFLYKFLFTSGTLDISLGEHRFVKIRVHKGLNSCTTSVSIDKYKE